MFFFGLFPSFDFDSLPFFLSALPRGLLFDLAPLFLLNSQSILGREARCFDLSPAAFFFRAQTHQLGFQLGDLFGGTGRDGRVFIIHHCRSFQCRRGKLRSKSRKLRSWRRELRNIWRGFRGGRGDRRSGWYQFRNFVSLSIRGLLGFENPQKFSLVSRQRTAQFFGYGALWRINDQAIVAGGFYLDALLAELGKQIMGCHSSITSRSV